MGTGVINALKYEELTSGERGARGQGSASRQAQSRGPRDLGRSVRLALPAARGPGAAARSVELGVQLVLLTELVREGDAGEELTPLAAHGVDVEENHQAGQQAQEDHLEDEDLAALAVQVKLAEADVGQEGEGQEEAADEARDVSEVVDPGQQPKGEQEEDHGRQLEEGAPGPCQDLPALEELHEQAGQDAKLRAGWAHLATVWVAVSC